jgi:hypothetical protein
MVIRQATVQQKHLILPRASATRTMGPCFRRDDPPRVSRFNFKQLIPSSRTQAKQSRNLEGKAVWIASSPCSSHDGETHFRLLATRSARVVQNSFALKNQRAQGCPKRGAGLPQEGSRESRVPVAPAASRVEKTRELDHRFTGITRPSLRDGFNGFLRALPGDRAFLSPSPAEILPPT